MSLCGHLGSYNTATTRTHVGFQFSTHAAAGGNVAPNSAFEAADIRIYKATDGAAFSATQRSSANGITITSPFDSLTGFHDVDIDLTDNTDAGFYAANCRYSVVLAPDETVDSQTLTGVVLAYFDIGRPQVDVRQFGGTDGTFSSGRPEVNSTHWSGTANATPDTAGYPKVTVKSGTGTGEFKLSGGYVAPNWGDVGNPTTTVGLTNTTIGIASLVSALANNSITAAAAASDFGAEIQALITGGAYALSTDANGHIRIVDGTGAGELDTLSGTVLLRAATQASIDAIELDTNELQTDWTNGGRLDLLIDAILDDTGTSGVKLADDAITSAKYDESTAFPLKLADSTTTALARRSDGGYVDGFVYVSSAGSSGQVNGTNGTIGNPCSSSADAVAVANARGIKRLKFLPVTPGTIETLAAADYTGFTIDLNGAHLDEADTTNAATAHRFCNSGPKSILVNSALSPTWLTLSSSRYENLTLIQTKIGGFCYVSNCEFSSVDLPGITFVEGLGNWRAVLANCYTTDSDMTINCASITGSTIHLMLLGWSGNLTITNMRAGMTIEVYGYAGKVTIASSSTGGTLRHTSHHEVTNNGGVTVDLVSEPGSVSGLTTAAKAEINAEVDTALTDYGAAQPGDAMDLVNAPNATAIAAIQSGLSTAAKLLSYIQSIARKDVTVDADIGGTYDDATDSLQAIRDRGDAAWTGGGGGGGGGGVVIVGSSVSSGEVRSGAIYIYANESKVFSFNITGADASDAYFTLTPYNTLTPLLSLPSGSGTETLSSTEVEVTIPVDTITPAVLANLGTNKVRYSIRNGTTKKVIAQGDAFMVNAP